MNTAQHTPGLWHVKQLSTYADTFEIRGPRESGVVVARTVEWGVAAEGEDPSEANARLIAAAPDMLVALRTAYSDIQSLPSHTIDMLGRIEAAIARATGSAA